MTDNEKRSPADLAGAYALDALGAEERAAFEEYLVGSEQARIEAAELSDTAVALGLATTPVQPSPDLKSSLMATLASTPQLPPLSAPAVDQPPDAATAAAIRATIPVAAPATTPAERRADVRWFRRPIGVLVAAAAAVALFVGGVVAGQAFNTNQFEQQQVAALAQINAAPDAQRASAVTSDGHQATLVWSGDLGKSALLIDDLPPLPGGKDYQLWYMRSTGAISAGTFDSDGEGTVWRVLQGRMKAGDAVGLTVEPSGGSKQPTSDPLVAIAS